jgi:hypothetical protein
MGWAVLDSKARIRHQEEGALWSQAERRLGVPPSGGAARKASDGSMGPEVCPTGAPGTLGGRTRP